MGPSPGCMWMLTTMPSHPPRPRALSIPPARFPSVNTQSPCLNPSPTPEDSGLAQDLSSQASLSHYRNPDVLGLQELAT